MFVYIPLFIKLNDISSACVLRCTCVCVRVQLEANLRWTPQAPVLCPRREDGWLEHIRSLTRSLLFESCAPRANRLGGEHTSRDGCLCEAAATAVSAASGFQMCLND